MPTSSIRLIALSLGTALVATASPALAQDPSATDAPVLSRQVPRGTFVVDDAPALAPAPKVVDGSISDWIGTAPGYGGASYLNAGEFVYQDYLFDAYGPDDGRDAERLAVLDPATDAIPEAYRIDALLQADAAGEFGLPLPDDLRYDTAYGDADGMQAGADLLEMRVAADASSVYLLARTTTMTDPEGSALLVLADTGGDPAERTVPFNSNISTGRADVALLLAGGRGWVADLATGTISELPAGSVATNAAGYDNAIEAAVPRSLLVQPGKACKAKGNGCANGAAFKDRLSLSAATGLHDGSGALAELPFRTADVHANLANVAFRGDEPVREWFDKRQALALHGGTIDPFFAEIDVNALPGGATQSLEPGPGYHERIFDSAPEISRESGRDGIHQHYGAYVPTSYDGTEPTPLQLWLHWRGGNAHTGAHLTPRLFKHYGEDFGTIVVSPSGRGTGRWYVGKGHADFREVWADAFETFSIDDDRVYVSGHSMGGWGTYLMTILYPDRFAAGAPVAGPVTQGAWTGLDFEGCDEFSSGEYSPCYVSANDGRPRDQHTRKLLENVRNVPLAILQGAADELVWVTGVTRQAERLVELNYRHRYYLYPTYEHYSHPVNDQWAEAGRYMHSFVRDENPARVTYKRDMAFERATEEVQADGLTFDWDFDSAYWMSELTPVAGDGVASFDGTTLADPDPAHLAVPESGPPATPGTTGPYVMTGMSWIADPTAAAPAPVNGFAATLTGASRVRLDLERMSVDVAEPIAGTVTTDSPLELELTGAWASVPTVTVDGSAVPATLTDGVLTIPLNPGAHELSIAG